ncbi:MAG TPA: hypothetical protein VFD32_23775 [Dehalococcoidia bacterium]|nr:hypothetical protein [Dehalococcoidia bacterium]
MSALTAYFALAGVLPFSIVLAISVRSVRSRAQRTGQAGFAGLALTLVMLAALAAIDTGFITLAIRSAALAMHPAG